MEGIIEDITKMIESLSRPKLKQYDLEREAQLQGRASSKSFEVTQMLSMTRCWPRRPRPRWTQARGSRPATPSRRKAWSPGPHGVLLARWLWLARLRPWTNKLRKYGLLRPQDRIMQNAAPLYFVAWPKNAERIGRRFFRIYYTSQKYKLFNSIKYWVHSIAFN